MKYDKFFLKYAFNIANLGKFTTTPNPNVGCIVVINNYIIGEGYHQNKGNFHAEINALNMAGKKAKNATIYVTFEPCSHYGETPPCINKLISFGIKRIVISILDPNPKISGNGFSFLKKKKIIVNNNIIINKNEKINIGFLKRMRIGFPKITLKLASSIDGCTGMKNKESKWITSKKSRKDVQCFRAENDAILSSSTTIISDNSTINIKRSNLTKNIKDIYYKKKLRQPIKIIIDNYNLIKPFYKIIQNKTNIWLIRTKKDKLIWPKKTKQIILPKQKNKKNLDLVLLMIQLGEKQINNVWIETGYNLSGSLLTNGLIDEFILYIAPKLLGNKTLPLFKISNLKKINEAIYFKIKNIKKIEKDIRIRLKPNIKY